VRYIPPKGPELPEITIFGDVTWVVF
jgi:hypothetical protein